MNTWSGDAVIFDLDGVLIDADLIYERHWTRWALEHDIPGDEVLAIHHGRPAIETMRVVAPHIDVTAEAHRFNAALGADTELSGIQAHDGAAELLERLPADRWAIATSAPRSIAVARLRALALTLPRVLVTIDDVTAGKPAPDPYLMAARRLGVGPADCVVIEDAPAGIQAALAAGAYVVAVSSTNPIGALHDAHGVVARLSDVDIAADAAGIHVSWIDRARGPG